MRMPLPLPALVAVAAVAVFAAMPGGARAKEIVLPQEKLMWRASPLPGYQKVMQECTACHSADYAEYQPPDTKPAYWEAQIKRMKTVFNAPVPDEDIPLITDYLSKTYGGNKSATHPAPALKSAGSD